MLPGTAMFVYFGTLVLSVTSIVSGNVQRNDALYYSLLGVGLVALVVLIVVITIYARRAFKKAERDLEEKRALTAAENNESPGTNSSPSPERASDTEMTEFASQPR